VPGAGNSCTLGAVNQQTVTGLARFFLLAAVAAITVLAITDRPYPLIESVPDKLNHLAAFAVLALLADYAFPTARFGAAKILALAGYGLAIEAIQSLLPHRQGSALDLAADAAGIGLYALCLPVLVRIPVLRRAAKG
jgi:VanZ family protein